MAAASSPFHLTGARVGQAALLTWTGTGDPPAGIVVGPLKVVPADTVAASACNETGSDFSATGLGVRLITLS